MEIFLKRCGTFLPSQLYLIFTGFKLFDKTIIIVIYNIPTTIKDIRIVIPTVNCYPNTITNHTIILVFDLFCDLHLMSTYLINLEITEVLIIINYFQEYRFTSCTYVFKINMSWYLDLSLCRTCSTSMEKLRPGNRSVSSLNHPLCISSISNQ